MKWINSSVLLTTFLIFSAAHAGPAVSGGGSPFIYSTSILQTIFSSPMVWQNILGGIERIVLVKQNSESAIYQISTTESVAIKDTRGLVIKWDKQPCVAVITVTNVSTDVFVPKLEVTNVNFSKCPSAQH